MVFSHFSPVPKKCGGCPPGQSAFALEHQMARGRAGDEVHRRRMQVLGNRVNFGMPLTEAEWAAWRPWTGLAWVARGSTVLMPGYWLVLRVFVLLVRRLQRASS